MRSLTLSAALVAATLASGAFAQGYSSYRDDSYDRGRYYGNSYRDEYGGRGILDRTRGDLEHGASVSYYAPRQKEHFGNALRQLNVLEGKLNRGKFDRHALDSAISELAHLARAGELEPRVRDRMGRDADDLRVWRARSAYQPYYPR